MGMILQPGKNCWRLVPAERVGFAIDAANYFGALADAMDKATQTVLVVGWDIDSRMRLDGYDWQHDERNLAAFFTAALRRKPQLRIYLLSWDFALIFALEREPLPTARHAWNRHRRVRFVLDGSHPLAASHHQKIVVVDDAFAFAGGLDLTIRRFDTREHRPQAACRTDPAGHPYGPFHDVQIAVSGEAAAALGALARARWLRATGETLPENPPAGDRWPASLPPAAHHVLVAISRTEPAYNGRPPVAEIRQLYVDALTAARRYIYIENQYFTAAAVGDVLQAILRGADPPEVIVVLPRRTSGWLQERTMGLLRARLVGLLRAADHRGRLRICYPHADDLGGDYIRLHSKVLLVDDNLLSIGSANTNNRSMGLDSECNLSLEAGGEARIAQAIRRFKEDLLAEHLGLSPGEVHQRLRTDPSLVRLIDACARQTRHLHPVEDPPIDVTDVPEAWIADPEAPVDARDLIPEELHRHARLRLLRNAILLTALASLSALWPHTPLRASLDLARLVHLLHTATALSAAPLITLAAFVLGGATFFPITLLIVATAVVFPVPQSALYAFLGCLASTSVNYAAGRLLDEQRIERLGGHRWRRLRRHLKDRGLMTMITMGLVPVAPFTLVTMGAGSLHVRYRNVLIGAAIGVIPGITAISLFTGTLTRALAHPDPAKIAILVMMAGIMVSFILRMRRWLAKRRDKQAVFSEE